MHCPTQPDAGAPTPTPAPAPAAPNPAPTEPPASTEPRRPWHNVRLMGVSLAAATQTQVVEHILDELGHGRGGWIVTANLDILRKLCRDRPFVELTRRVDVIVADGMPLVWAAKLRGTPLPERVAGSSMVLELADAAAEAGRSLYLLGGNPGAAEAAARVLQCKFPKLRIAGVDCPPVGFESSEAEMSRIRSAIVNASPDIVYVALGCPKQERLIAALRDEVAGGAWWIGVGISLSFLSGEVRRAPRWMQKLGLEWVHRLVQEPRRLARRYLVEGVPFAAGLVAWALFTRLRRNGAIE